MRMNVWNMLTNKQREQLLVKLAAKYKMIDKNR